MKQEITTEYRAKLDAPFWLIMSLCTLMFVCLFLQVGCVSRPTQPGAMSANEYNSLILKHTRSGIEYDGFYNKFELHATFLNSEVQTAVLQRKSEVLKWSAKQLQSEREKLFQENSNQTKFALSLYVPSPRLNDLHKSSSIWRVYLETGGQRYEGKVTRRNGKLEEIQALFNYHNRWSTAYEVVFNVPLSGVEQNKDADVSFTLTSTQGTAVLKY